MDPLQERIGLGTLANAIVVGLVLDATLPFIPEVQPLGARISLRLLAVGWLLGGSVGVGTLLYALVIGPLVAWLLPRLAVRGDPLPGRVVPAAAPP